MSIKTIQCNCDLQFSVKGGYFPESTDVATVGLPGIETIEQFNEKIEDILSQFVISGMFVTHSKNLILKFYISSDVSFSAPIQTVSMNGKTYQNSSGEFNMAEIEARFREALSVSAKKVSFTYNLS